MQKALKLTKLQRHTAYIILLALYEEDERKKEKVSQGFCARFGMDLLGMARLEDWENCLKYLPELKAKKPFTHEGFGSWFGVYEDGRKKRIALLKECITETAL